MGPVYLSHPQLRQQNHCVLTTIELLQSPPSVFPLRSLTISKQPDSTTKGFNLLLILIASLNPTVHIRTSMKLHACLYRTSTRSIFLLQSPITNSLKSLMITPIPAFLAFPEINTITIYFQVTLSRCLPLHLTPRFLLPIICEHSLPFITLLDRRNSRKPPLLASSSSMDFLPSKNKTTPSLPYVPTKQHH